MRQLLRLERRLQDLERRLENTVKRGKVKDVKFNKEEKRWYIRMEDGQEGDPKYFRTDWVPWDTFSHGTIRMSVPPRKGQAVAVHSPNGEPEVSYAKPYHNTKEAPSPHDKEDEIFISIEEPDQEGEGSEQKNQNKKKITFHGKNNSYEIKSGQMTTLVSDTKIEGKVGNASVTIENGKIVIKVDSSVVTVTGGNVNVKSATISMDKA